MRRAGTLTEVDQEQTWTVGPAAEAVGTTVRALHHYDALGLVVPSGRTAAGYRVYTGADLDRLRAVLVHRELGFALDEVAALLDGDADDRLRLVREQLDRVSRRIDRLQQVRAALETEMEATDERHGADPGREARAVRRARGPRTRRTYAARGRGALGGHRRLPDLGAADLAVHQGGLGGGRRPRPTASTPGSSRCCGPGSPRTARRPARWPRSTASTSAAGSTTARPRCTPASGRMYVEDERFTQTYEDIAPGLAAYVSTAVQANAAARG